MVTNPSEEAVLTAARELIVRRGTTARDEAMARVTELEWQGNWPEHALESKLNQERPQSTQVGLRPALEVVSGEDIQRHSVPTVTRR